LHRLLAPSLAHLFSKCMMHGASTWTHSRAWSTCQNRLLAAARTTPAPHICKLPCHSANNDFARPFAILYLFSAKKSYSAFSFFSSHYYARLKDYERTEYSFSLLVQQKVYFYLHVIGARCK